MLAPSTNGSNGRGSGGRFALGNPGGPGNPLAKKTAALRRAFQECVGEEDIRAVVAELIARAKAGEPWAVRELLDRALGKPKQAEMSDEADEPGNALTFQPNPFLGEFADFLDTLPSEQLPQRMKDWLRFYKFAQNLKEDDDPNFRMERLARKGLESLRRHLGDHVELPPGTFEEQADFVLAKLNTDPPPSWR